MLRCAVVAAALALMPSVARAHAALLHSTPRGGSVADSGLTAIRLVFSEEMVPDLCHVGLMTPHGAHVDLAVSSDPHDVHVIVAPVSHLAPGAYHVMWHAVSADGHPVSGKFGFTVASSVAPSAKAAAPVVAQGDSSEIAGEQNPFPFAAALARGIGVTALLSLAGLLVFAGAERGARDDLYLTLEKILAAVASLGLVAHIILWCGYVLPGAMFTSATWAAMLDSSPGRLELLRVVAVLLASALVFARVRAFGAAFPAAVAVILSGVIGHPLSSSPLYTIPVTVVHLAAVALWAGGIISLIAARRSESVAFRAHALVVSRVALIAFLVTAMTGAAQSALLLTAASDLFSTPYGRLILAKIAGLIVLGTFGAYHRLRVIPRLPSGGQTALAISLRYEMMVMSLIIIVAAFLSYTPLPR